MSMVVYYVWWLVRIWLVVLVVSRYRCVIEISDGIVKLSDNLIRFSFIDFVGFIGSIVSGYCVLFIVGIRCF